MALGTGTVGIAAGHDNRAVFCDLITFLGDDAYVAGGTADFEAYMRTLLNRGAVDVIGVVGQDCGGYTPVYDRANDKLKVFRTDQVDDPMEEVPDGDLSSVTFNVLVFSV